MGRIGTKSTPVDSEAKFEKLKAGSTRTDDDAIGGHVLACDLQPTSRSCAKIYAAPRAFKKSILFVELDELEC